MKHTLKLTIIALVISLTACSTNTRDQNTAIGAGTGAVIGGVATGLASGSGWVIAAGAVVGALIGGFAGHNMDSSDSAHINSTMNNNGTNQPSNWTNSKTGTWYKIVPTGGMMTYKGNPNCRKYIAYARTTDGQTAKTRGISCRMDNGMWQQVK